MASESAICAPDGEDGFGCEIAREGVIECIVWEGAKRCHGSAAGGVKRADISKHDRGSGTEEALEGEKLVDAIVGAEDGACPVSDVALIDHCHVRADIQVYGYR